MRRKTAFHLSARQKSRQARVLVPEGDIAWTRIAWAPDGRSITYVTRDKQQQAIHVATLDGSCKQIAVGGADLTCADWLPDSKRLVYAPKKDAKSEVVVQSVGDSEGKVLLATDLVLTDPAVSPDGKWLAVFGTEAGKRQGRFYFAPLAGGSFTALGPKEPGIAETDFVFWLADNKRLATLIYEPSGVVTHIHVFNIETLEDKNVTMKDQVYKMEFAITRGGRYAYYDATSMTDGVLWEVDLSEAVTRVR